MTKLTNSARVQIITSPIVNSIINIWYDQVSKRGRHFNLRILSYWRSITKDIWCCCLVKASYFPLIMVMVIIKVVIHMWGIEQLLEVVDKWNYMEWNEVFSCNPDPFSYLMIKRNCGFLFLKQSVAESFSEPPNHPLVFSKLIIFLFMTWTFFDCTIIHYLC